jgi:hypothetical protein
MIPPRVANKIHGARLGRAAILLSHDLTEADAHQRLPKLLIGLLDERRDFDDTELHRVVGAPDAVGREHLVEADGAVDKLEELLDSCRGIPAIIADHVQQAGEHLPAHSLQVLEQCCTDAAADVGAEGDISDGKQQTIGRHRRHVDPMYRHYIKALQIWLYQPSSVSEIATSSWRRSDDRRGSAMRKSSTMRLMMMRVDGSSYPFVSDTTSCLKRCPPAARREMPPPTT